MTLQLFPYQQDGAAFLAPRLRCGLFDLPGVGKSAQVVGALDMAKAQRVIIVCPAAVREHWRGELRKFSSTPWRIVKANSIHDVGAWLKGKADILLLSYERATRWADHLQGDLFDVIVFDESHYMKSMDSARTRAMLGARCDGAGGLARWAAQTWFLTGTPMPNDPMDVYPFLRFTGATTLNPAPFTARYFDVSQRAFGTRQKPREAYAPELRAAIEAYSLRRTKEMVGLQVPPIFLTTTAIDGDTAEIRELLREHPGLEQAVVDAVNNGGLSNLQNMELPIATLRRLVGEAKAPAYAEMLIDEFKGGRGKTVIMGVHIAALATIDEKLKKAGIDGVLFTNTNKVSEELAAFQNDPKKMFFAVNIRRGGTGLDGLQKVAEDIDMFESAWTPGDNHQALMRVARQGQRGAHVRGRFIELANSLDQHVTQTVKSKTEAIMQVDTVAA